LVRSDRRRPERPSGDREFLPAMILYVLFGFEHTQEISKHTAGEIALAAQHFGQDDDITVLTLVRIAD
jgi:hypothetical protein